jgi:hypothetical protein
MGHHPHDLVWVTHGEPVNWSAQAAAAARAEAAPPLMGHLPEAQEAAAGARPRRGHRAYVVKEAPAWNQEMLDQREAARAEQRRRELELQAEYYERIKQEQGQ